MKSEKTERTLLIIDTIFQQLLAVFVLLILWEVFKSYNLDNIGAWHIVLCTLGFALFMAEALLLFNKENNFLKGMDRSSRGTVHIVASALGFICVTTGVALKIKQKADVNAQHFSSTHGCLGIVAWSLTIIAVILGIVAANVRKFPTLGRPALYRIVHLLIGVSAYVIGIICLGFGLHYLVGLTGTHGRNALLVFLGLYVGYSLIGPIKSCYNYFFP